MRTSPGPSARKPTCWPNGAIRSRCSARPSNHEAANGKLILDNHRLLTSTSNKYGQWKPIHIGRQPAMANVRRLLEVVAGFEVKIPSQCTLLIDPKQLHLALRGVNKVDRRRLGVSRGF